MFKDFTGLSTHMTEALRQERQAEVVARLQRAQRCQDERVVGGVYRPEPANKESAMLLAKASWLCHPPPSDPVFGVTSNTRKETRNEITQNKKRIQRENKRTAEKADTFVRTDATQNSPLEALMNDTTNNDNSPLMRGIQLKAQTKDGDVAYSLDDIAIEMALAIQRNAPKELSELARVAVDSRRVIRESSDDIGQIVSEFDRIVSAATQSVRSKRMTIVSECASVVNALKDVRQFFLGPDYERETKRLAEFVELCERMKALKDSGFLDTVADTMIRLASTEK